MSALVASKGDLIVVESVRDSGSLRGDRTILAYEVGVVASVRGGQPAKWTQLSMGPDRLLEADFTGRPIAVPLPPYSRHWVVPKSHVDVPRVLAAAKAHHWPGHPEQPMPFESLAEVRALIPGGDLR